ncbi:MAG: glutaredoxin domain-containing protein [Arenicellales bacterium]
MKKLIFVVLAAFTIYYFKPGLFTAAKQGAFDENGKPEVWFFTSESCGQPCDEITSILDKRVDYTEFYIDENDAKQKLKIVGAPQAYPLTVIGKQIVIGNDTMKVVSTLAEEIGPDTLTSMEKKVMESHFYEDNTPAIVMYGTSSCGYCIQMREYFKKNSIQYTELDVESEAENAFAILKGRGTPLIYIGYRRIGGANIQLVEKTISEYNL